MSALLPESIGSSLIVYNYTDETLIGLRERAKDVRLTDIGDADGLARVRETRLGLRDVRVAIEKRRVELKADALKYGQRVDAEAKRLTAIIEPQERRLQEEEDAVKREADRIKAIAEQARRDAAEKRSREIQAVTIPGDAPALLGIIGLPDDKYAETLSAMTHAHKLWSEEQAREREARRLEDQRLRDERAALDARQREQDARARQQEQAEAEIAQKREALLREQEEALPVPAADECVRLCPTCGQVWSGGAP